MTKKTFILILILSIIATAMCFAIFRSTVKEDSFEAQAASVEQVCTQTDGLPDELPDFYPLTFDEWHYVYGVIAAELRGGSQEGMTMIAECIRDRAMNGHYGEGVIGVLEKKNQFAKPYFEKLHPNKTMEMEIDDMIRTAIEDVFVYGVYMFDEPILHFHADYIEAPDWTNDLTELARIDGTIFYN